MDSARLIERIGELGARVNGRPENIAEVVPQLIALLAEHDDPAVIAAVIDALGCSWDETANLAVLAYADHPDSEVRFAVTCAIPGGTDSREGTELVAEALIRLSRDDVDKIRDWATFGLGSILWIDSDEVREALYARLADTNEDVRDEAVAGIARRRGTRAVEIVAQFLADETVGPLVFEAAAFLADPRLRDSLLRWRTRDPENSLVANALQACDPEYQSARTERHEELLIAVNRAVIASGTRGSPFMFCERDDDLVSLSLDRELGTWNVDALIERAGGDVQEAARLVVADVATSEPRDE